MNMPIPFDVINLINSCYSPNSVVKRNNYSYNFYCRYLYDKLKAVFKFTMPETFGEELFKNALFANGYVTILPSDEFGLLAQWGVGGGYTVNYTPRFVLVANPLLPDISGKELIIDEDCAVIRLNGEWSGVLDLVSYYAEKMALASQAVDTNLINTKIAYIFAAKDKAQAQTFKKALDRIYDGEPAVILDKTLFDEEGKPAWNAFTQKPKDIYLVSDLLNDLAKIEDEFDTRIGIPNANTDKRERLITDEVNANNVETAILADDWLEHIRAGCDRVREMYGAEITVDWRYKPNVPNTEQSDAINPRAV